MRSRGSSGEMEMTKLSHKEMTAWIRTCIRRHKIKARVRKKTFCGDKIIQVSVPTYDSEFTEQEQREIRQIAIDNGLTWVMSMEINPEQMTNPKAFNFFFHGAVSSGERDER